MPPMRARGIVWFTAAAYVIGWLLTLPLWIVEGGLAHWSANLLLPLMMFAPAAAVPVARRVDREGRLRDATGLGLGAAGWWKHWAFNWIAFPAFCLLAPFVGALFGLYPLDLEEFSGFRTIVVDAGGGSILDTIPAGTLVALQAGSVLLAPVFNAPFALGEEIGWRGYLLPRLLPLGQVRALVISGAIWGAWHAPVILLGYNYPKAPVRGVFQMIVFCVVMGILLGWSRLATGSVWPAVIGHGALNGSAGAVALFHRAGAELDSSLVGITGWTGLILPVLVIAVLVMTRRIPVERPSA